MYNTTQHTKMKYNVTPYVFTKNKVLQKTVYLNNKLYSILNYDPTVLCYDNIEAATYRSVIFSAMTNTLLCFSPPKSLSNQVFINKYPQPENHEMVVNECIEGVMVNLFYDAEMAKWEIATKSCIGGGNRIANRGPTVRRMFLDALKSNYLNDINNIEWFSLLPKSFAYCFVLQHPANRILLSIQSPKIYLVSLYMINSGKMEAEYIPATVYEKWPIWQNLQSAAPIIHFPQQQECFTYEELYNTNTMSPGYMVTNTITGEKTKIPNYRYEKIKHGNRIPPFVQYQYLCYRRIFSRMHNGVNIVENSSNAKWIHEMPKPNKTKKQMLDVNADVEEFIQNVYCAYKNKYVYKSITPIAEKYETHIYKIHHTIYIPSLCIEKTPITLNVVKAYFNAIDPKEMLYIINGDRRQL